MKKKKTSSPKSSVKKVMGKKEKSAATKEAIETMDQYAGVMAFQIPEWLSSENFLTFAKTYLDGHPCGSGLFFIGENGDAVTGEAIKNAPDFKAVGVSGPIAWMKDFYAAFSVEWLSAMAPTIDNFEVDAVARVKAKQNKQKSKKEILKVESIQVHGTSLTPKQSAMIEKINQDLMNAKEKVKPTIVDDATSAVKALGLPEHPLVGTQGPWMDKLEEPPVLEKPVPSATMPTDRERAESEAGALVSVADMGISFQGGTLEWVAEEVWSAVCAMADEAGAACQEAGAYFLSAVELHNVLWRICQRAKPLIAGFIWQSEDLAILRNESDEIILMSMSNYLQEGGAA